MSEKNRRILLVVILILAVIWAGFNYPFGSKSKRSETLAETNQVRQIQSQAQRSPETARLALDTLPEVSAAELSERTAQPWPRDPFYKRPAKRVQRKNHSKRSFKLKAIVYNDTAPSAYLNGRVVHQGDRISGATVIKISPKAVTLRIGQEYRKIKLK